MCLTIITNGKRPRPKKAEEDIVCYKLVKILEHSNGKQVIISPFQQKQQWTVGVVKKASCLIRPIATRLILWREFKINEGIFQVGEGYLHSYKDLEKALEASEEASRCDMNYTVYKAIIPKGTYYFEGDTEWFLENGKRGYASRKLKLIEEVK